MADDFKITLAGKEYPIAPLNLASMRKVWPAFSRIGYDTPEGIAATISVITAAMSAADPDVKMETVDALVGVTLKEIMAAANTVANMIGLIEKAPASGEAVAP